MPAVLLIAGAACLVVVARCAARQQKGLRSLLGGAVCGVASLAALAILAPLTGVALPLNRFTGFVAAVLGLPGVITLVLLDILL